MIFSQFSGCDSVRDISNGLKSATGNLNHLGISHAPSKSTVAYQNARRDSSVFREIYYMLLQHFGQQAEWQHGKFRFKMPIRLLDSTLITLTLDFPIICPSATSPTSLSVWRCFISSKG